MTSDDRRGCNRNWCCEEQRPLWKNDPYLIVLAGSGFGEMYKLDRRETVLGRSDGVHVYAAKANGKNRVEIA